MDAVEFIKAINRLCKEQEYCEICPMLGYACDEKTSTIMDGFNLESVQKMVEVCEQWAKDHPAKTRQSEFLKMFPNAKFDMNHILQIEPCKIDITREEHEVCKSDKFKCTDCRREYWLEKVSE